MRNITEIFGYYFEKFRRLLRRIWKIISWNFGNNCISEILENHFQKISKISRNSSDIFKKYFGKFREIFSKKMLDNILETFENCFRNIMEKFRKISRNISESLEKHCWNSWKIFQNFRELLRRIWRIVS